MWGAFCGIILLTYTIFIHPLSYVFPHFPLGPTLLMDDSFLVKGVKAKEAFDLIKKLDNFGKWSLGGNVEKTENWTSKRPFNVNAVSCSMAQKDTKIMGMLFLYESFIVNCQLSFFFFFFTCTPQ